MLLLTWRAGNRVWRELKDLPLRAAVALGAAGLGQPPRRGQLFKAYGIVLPIGLFAWWAMPQLTLVMTPSIDAWVVHRSPGPIRRGDLVSFLLSDPLVGLKPVNVTKYALCLPGDRIIMIEKPATVGRGWTGWYHCNGRLMGVAKPLSRSGKALDRWRPESPHIPDGMIFVGSRHPDGYDSRYYGPVSIARLTRMEKLL